MMRDFFKRISFVVGIVCVFIIAAGFLFAQEIGGTSKSKKAKAQKLNKEKVKVAEKVIPKPEKEGKGESEKSEKEKPNAATKEKPAIPIKKKESDVYQSMLDELTEIVARQEKERIAESERRIAAVKEKLGKHLKLIQQRHAEKEAEYQKAIKEFRNDLLDLNKRIEQLIEKYTPASEKQQKLEKVTTSSPMKKKDIAAAKVELFKAGMDYFFRAAGVYIPIDPFIEVFSKDGGVSISVYDNKHKEDATAQVNLSYDKNNNIVGLVSKGEDYTRGEWKKIPPKKK